MARKKLKVYQLAISQKTLGMDFSSHINRIQQELLIPINIALSLPQLQKNKTNASKELNKIMKNTRANRKQHLLNLLRKYESEGNNEVTF